MIYWNTPKIIISFYTRYIWHFSRKDKAIYLSFDDGPTPGVTEKVLDILDFYNAKATFFVLGRNVERHPELIKLILERGHAVGNHTYSHLKGWKTPTKMYIHDSNLAGNFISTNLFRPPYGRITKKQAAYLLKFYKIIMWDVLTHDYNKYLPVKMILQNIIRSTKNGSIVVFHDSAKASDKMLYVLPNFLEYFKKNEYEFKKIEI